MPVPDSLPKPPERDNFSADSLSAGALPVELAMPWLESSTPKVGSSVSCQHPEFPLMILSLQVFMSSQPRVDPRY